jgi:hypothetical protein
MSYSGRGGINANDNISAQMFWRQLQALKKKIFIFFLDTIQLQCIVSAKQKKV